MLSTKLNSYPRIIKLASKTRKCEFNLQNTGHTQLACIYTISKNHEETTVLNTTSNLHYKPWVKVLPNYSTQSMEPIEIPPPKPPSSKEADVFGTMGGLKYEAVELDADELKEEERLKILGGRVPRKFKPSAGQYADMIKTYLSKGDLHSAEEVIMECKRNNDTPTPYMFTLLINAFAQHGDVKKCFQYFGHMKNRKDKIGSNIYTSLLNACANAPESDKVLRYLERIRDHMKQNEVELNHAHYNVLVKAYGRQKQLEEAYKFLDEMEERKLKIGISTINSLMYAANSNIESGLKHVMQLWQMMRKKGVSNT